MLLDIDLLTLSLGVGLKLPPYINPVSGQMGRPCPGISKKVWHLYVSLMLLEIDLLTLSLDVGLKLPNTKFRGNLIPPLNIK